MASYKSTLNDRQSSYDNLDPIVMRARNMLKASGADKSTLDNAETHVRKLLGRRKSARPKPAPQLRRLAQPRPQTPNPLPTRTSQLSFENRSGNLDSFVEVIAGVATTNPTKPIESLRAARPFKRPQVKEQRRQLSFAPLSQAAAPATSCSMERRTASPAQPTG